MADTCSASSCYFRFGYGRPILISSWKMKMTKRIHTVFAFQRRIYCWYAVCG